MSDFRATVPQRADFAAPSTKNPFASDVPATRPIGSLANVEQQRAIAEVQARMIVARSNPRDPIQCMDLILRDCTRPTLAEAAIYQYSRGGTSVSGPSIRLAEAMAQRWGNIQSGIKEISRANGYSECVAYAWDLQVMFYDERQFQVRHWRDTRQGGYALTDERDIAELLASQGQRRKRACLLAVIPGDVVEAAVQQCEETLHVSADTSPEALARIATAFESFGVTKTQIEKRCQCRLEAIRPAQVVQLRKIFASLKDGMSDAKDWFDAPNGAWEGVEAQHAASPPPARPNAPQTPPEPPKPRGRPRKQQAAADDAPSWMDEAPPVTTSAPPDASPERMEQAPAPEVEEAPTSSSGATFSAWLVDGEGRLLTDGNETPIKDPMEFARRYVEELDHAHPSERELMKRANMDAIAEACAFPGVMGIINPPAEPSLDLAPAKISPAQEIFVRLDQSIMACTTVEAVTALGNSVDFVAAVKEMHAAEPALWGKLKKIADDHKRHLSAEEAAQ